MSIERRYAPPEALKPVFSHFYEAINDTLQTIPKQLFPSFQTKLVFDLGAPTPFELENGQKTHIEKFIIIGPSKHIIHYEMVPGSRILVANFSPDGYFRLFGSTPPRGLKNGNLQLGIIETCILDIQQQLQMHNNDDKCIEIISEICLRYDSEKHPVSELLAKNIDGKLSPIKIVAEKTSLGERRLQALHKAQFGFTAKEYHRYQRFLKVTKYIDAQQQKIDWAQIVLDFGYFDQSQLIRDFQYYLGKTPTAYCNTHGKLCGMECFR